MPGKPLSEQPLGRVYGGILFCVAFLAIVVAMLASVLAQPLADPANGPWRGVAAALGLLAFVFFGTIPVLHIIASAREIRRRKRNRDDQDDQGLPRHGGAR